MNVLLHQSVDDSVPSDETSLKIDLELEAATKIFDTLIDDVTAGEEEKCLHEDLKEERDGNWWHPSMESLAAKLTTGVLNEMKRRIQTSNIRKEKLTLGEDTERMKNFFAREIARYSKRVHNVGAKKHEIAALQEKIVHFREEITKLQGVVEKQMTVVRKLAAKYAEAKRELENCECMKTRARCL